MESPFVYTSSYIRPYAAEQAFLARSEMEALSVTQWAYILEDIPDKCKPLSHHFTDRKLRAPLNPTFSRSNFPGAAFYPP
jgi:hypothetical protein